MHAYRPDWTYIVARPAADTASEGLIADPEGVCADPLHLQGLSHLLQRRIRTSRPMGAPVYQKYVHGPASFLIGFLLPLF